MGLWHWFLGLFDKDGNTLQLNTYCGKLAKENLLQRACGAGLR
jgi:hypothetical protein